MCLRLAAPIYHKIIFQRRLKGDGIPDFVVFTAGKKTKSVMDGVLGRAVQNNP